MGEDFYRLMYSDGEQEELGGGATSEFTKKSRLGKRVMRLQVGEQTVDFPALDYVLSLEKTIEDLSRTAKKAEILARQLRELVNRQAKVIDELRTDLDNKLDIRDI